MWKIWYPFVIFFLLIFYGEAGLKKQVCVIGAGRAGLAAIKLATEQMNKFNVIAYDRNSDVGGLWIYKDNNVEDPKLPPQGSIYKNLRTITPKESMTYPDYPKLISPDRSPFVSHKTFLEYMRNYSNHFQLHKHIQHNTFVTKVTPIIGNKNRWLIQNRNLKTNQDDETVCDAVMLCNGRFSKPNIPKIPGIETFPGEVLHSHSYRSPEKFANRTVVILGAGASGVGISLDISRYAKTVYLSRWHRSCVRPKEYPENIEIVRAVVRVDGNVLTLHDESKITADTFIYCTGYVYDFPFLDKSTGIVVDQNCIHPLYKDFINEAHQSMAFIGMGNNDIFPFDYYSQTNSFLASLQGK